MFKIRWRPFDWIITQCWFDLLRSAFSFYQLCGWFHIYGFGFGYLPELSFDVKFYVIINFRKPILKHLSFYHNRYILCTLLDHTNIIIKPEPFPVRVITPIRMGLSSFIFFKMKHARKRPYILLNVEPHLKIYGPIFSAHTTWW